MIRVVAASLLLASCSMMSSGPAASVPVAAGAMPGSSSGSLLYVSGNGGSVDVFSYPALKHLGVISGFGRPSGECADALGNVWITDYGASRVVEYAHGATQPTTTLTIDFPYYCAIDQASGDIAVLGHGNLAIFSKEQSPPVYYSFPQTGSPLCAYDNKGDLFVESDEPEAGRRQYKLLELHKGAKKLQTITFLGTAPLGGGSMLWDGSELLFGRGNGETQGTARDFYHVSVSGNRAMVTSTTAVDVSRTERPETTVSQYAVAGSAILGPWAEFGRSNAFAVWKYPKGGKWIALRRPAIGEIRGVAISP